MEYGIGIMGEGIINTIHLAQWYKYNTLSIIIYENIGKISMHDLRACCYARLFENDRRRFTFTEQGSQDGFLSVPI